MLDNQRELFQIKGGVTFLNCAYMSPLLKKTEHAASEALVKRRNPHHYTLEDFFEPVEKLKSLFSQIIQTDEKERLAVIPSASYGISNAANNINYRRGGKIIMVEGQFPSNYYIWESHAKQNDVVIKMIEKGHNWNDRIIDSINEKTVAVVMPQVHWANGFIFDLETIGERCRKFGSYFIIDGTQSVGAFPFDQRIIKADALICAAYKWLLGPYSFGLAYYGEKFDGGKPIEENWMPKLNSDKFAGLTEYQPEFREKAWRYNVGEMSNFIYVPMMTSSIEQILKWEVSSIQESLKSLTDETKNSLRDLGCGLEENEQLAGHLFGFIPNNKIDREELNSRLVEKKIFISHRGEYIRVSPHLYNTKEDLNELVDTVQEFLV